MEEADCDMAAAAPQLLIATRDANDSRDAPRAP